jgi:quercetin dioxygenase-like cupin family protein
MAVGASDRAALGATGSFDLSKTPIHLGSQGGVADPAVPLPGFGFDGPSFEAYISNHCKGEAPGRLVMVETTPSAWPAWECHTEGDELVIVLEGKAEFIQEIEGQELRIAVRPGSTVINPARVWHTADVEEPLKAIYLTPIPGTESRKRQK